jgi:GNAT superfamily N-acetyltransferase
LRAIRPATINDLPTLEPIAREFYACSKFLEGFDIDHFCSVWTQLFDSGLGVIFLALKDDEIVGALGGVAYPEIYTGEMVASEFFWFIRAEHRGGGLKLYRAFEQWAKDMKCGRIRMVHLLDSMPEKLQTTYLRLGFAAAEVHYTKEI